ncbi:MAG: nickel pincer cofactor biosynthesis protein LarC, partial [Blastocatellia bacterium]
MSQALYFDCFAGASGDMIVGALLDLGLDFQALRSQLSLLPLSGYELGATRVTRAGLAATRFEVAVQVMDQPHRGLREIDELIGSSRIGDPAKSTALAIFSRLAEAEARVHGTSIEQVHFHEVGAVDSIIDITGAAIGFELLGVEKFFASALRVGYGTIRAAHGLLPVPGPATAELLVGAPIYAGDIEGEFVTPTGAAILATLCSFGPMPHMTLERTGYGAGTRDPSGLPNVLRAATGSLSDEVHSNSWSNESHPAPEHIVIIETNIDDMNPQVYGYVFERAFELGALDIFTTPIQMKKDRPATKLTVLTTPDKLN